MRFVGRIHVPLKVQHATSRRNGHLLLILAATYGNIHRKRSERTRLLVHICNAEIANCDPDLVDKVHATTRGWGRKTERQMNGGAPHLQGGSQT